jgi:hypothetical protein
MICRPGGYTASMRPPQRVTDPEKRALMAAYDNTEPLGNVETDHILSLSFGGVPNDPANQYPGPNYPGVSLGGLVRREDDTFVRSGRRAWSQTVTFGPRNRPSIGPSQESAGYLRLVSLPGRHLGLPRQVQQLMRD